MARMKSELLAAMKMAIDGSTSRSLRADQVNEIGQKLSLSLSEILEAIESLWQEDGLVDVAWGGTVRIVDIAPAGAIGH